MCRLDVELDTIGRCLGACHACHACPRDLAVDVREHPDLVYWIVDAAESDVGCSVARDASLLQGHDADNRWFADKSHRDQQHRGCNRACDYALANRDAPLCKRQVGSILVSA